MPARPVPILLALTLLTATTPGRGIQPPVSPRVQSRTVVATGPAQHLLYEPQLARDPTNPARWLAASIVHGSAAKYPESQKDQTCAAFVSNDDGKSWTRHDFPVTGCADPWTAITPGGQFLVSVLAASTDFPQQGEAGLLVFRSDDGGRTWSDHPVGLGRGHDHDVMVVDLTNSPRRGWVYISSHRGVRADEGLRRFGPWVARSRDGGKTFDDPVIATPNNLHNLSEMPVVLSDGTLVASFVDAGYFQAGSDGEGTFEARRAWVIRSTDGGHGFSTPMFVNDACGPPPGFRLSALAVDASSGASRDRLYFACRAKGGGAIVVNSSSDRGERWTAPVSMPADGVTPEERIPAIAVNRDGVVAAAWIDGRSEHGHLCEESVFISASRDGGVTWAAPTRVSSTPACADGTMVASSTGGDYFGLTAAADGSFRLLWSEMRNGSSDLVTVTVAVER